MSALVCSECDSDDIKPHGGYWTCCNCGLQMLDNPHTVGTDDELSHSEPFGKEHQLEKERARRKRRESGEKITFEVVRYD